MNISKLSDAEIKILTGEKNRTIGEYLLYKKLESRQWRVGEREAKPAGYDRRVDQVHFVCAWPLKSGGVGGQRVGVPLKVALENRSGIIEQYEVLG